MFELMPEYVLYHCDHVFVGDGTDDVTPVLVKDHVYKCYAEIDRLTAERDQWHNRFTVQLETMEGYRKLLEKEDRKNLKIKQFYESIKEDLRITQKCYPDFLGQISRLKQFSTILQDIIEGDKMDITLTLNEKELETAITEYLEKRGYELVKDDYFGAIDISVDETGDQRDPGVGAYAEVKVKAKE